MLLAPMMAIATAAKEIMHDGMTIAVWRRVGVRSRWCRTST